MNVDLVEKFEQAVRQDGRYPPEAYGFLQRGLELATRIKYGQSGEVGRQAAQRGEARHVTGRELCYALRYLAVQTWGALAGEVLRHWHIHRTRDFGEMVYLMIRLGLMGKQESDDISDFDDVYDFAEAFGSYQIRLEGADQQGSRD